MNDLKKIEELKFTYYSLIKLGLDIKNIQEGKKKKIPQIAFTYFHNHLFVDISTTLELIKPYEEYLKTNDPDFFNQLKYASSLFEEETI